LNLQANIFHLVVSLAALRNVPWDLGRFFTILSKEKKLFLQQSTNVYLLIINKTLRNLNIIKERNRSEF